MNNNYIITFVSGIAIGVITSTFVCSKIYEKRAKEEIDSVKESFKKYYEKNNNIPTEEKIDSYKSILKEEVVDYCDKETDNGTVFSNTVESDRKNYATIINTNKYELPIQPKTNTVPNTNVVKKPYIVPEDELDYLFDYNRECLEYHSDGVLTENDSVVPDPNEIVGDDFMNHFGENSDPDIVYIRNEALKTDYEIVRVDESYAELLENRPYLKGLQKSGDD